MEIWGKIVDENGAPIAGASLQRYYPDGQIYSSVLASADSGLVNGRVPGREYYWIVSAPGYLPMPVSLAEAVNDRPDLPIVVRLEADPLLAEIIPGDNLPGEKIPAAVWIVGGAAATVAALWFLGSPRDKVKMRKLIP